MNWARFVFGLNDALSLALVVRLIALGLHDVYRVFCAFLLCEVVSLSFLIIERFLSIEGRIDYRIVWLAFGICSWTLSIWMVYALLQAILHRLPGILKFSQRVLNVVFPLSVAIAILSAGPEYAALGHSGTPDRLAHLVIIGLILERLISTIAVITLLLMLLFVLWFPVRMPRNLAVFSIGFSVYFTTKTVLLLFHSFWSQHSEQILNLGVTSILCFCYIYWLVFLNKAGETAPVTLGHKWEAGKQMQLMTDLERINAVLEHSGRR